MVKDLPAHHWTNPVNSDTCLSSTTHSIFPQGSHLPSDAPCTVNKPLVWNLQIPATPSAPCFNSSRIMITGKRVRYWHWYWVEITNNNNSNRVVVSHWQVYYKSWVNINWVEKIAFPIWFGQCTFLKCIWNSQNCPILLNSTNIWKGSKHYQVNYLFHWNRM